MSDKYPEIIYIKPEHLFDNHTRKPESSFAAMMYVHVNPWFEDFAYPETEYFHGEYHYKLLNEKQKEIDTLTERVKELEEWKTEVLRHIPKFGKNINNSVKGRDESRN